MEILALIPARSGSQRIPNKNIVSLNGKPLLAYTIEASKNSKYVHRIVVSTDSSEIADVAREYGAEAPFLRPVDISKNDSREIEFYGHALNWLSEHENYVPDLIVTLYPTAPFRKVSSIDSAIEKMLSFPEADSLRSVRLCSEHPYKMWQMNGDYLVPFVQEKDKNIHTLSYHLLPAVYVQNANIYITKPATILNKQSPMGDAILAFPMDEWESLDINTPVDLEIAEARFEKKRVMI